MAGCGDPGAVTSTREPQCGCIASQMDASMIAIPWSHSTGRPSATAIGTTHVWLPAPPQQSTTATTSRGTSGTAKMPLASWGRLGGGGLEPLHPQLKEHGRDGDGRRDPERDDEDRPAPEHEPQQPTPGVTLVSRMNAQKPGAVPRSRRAPSVVDVAQRDLAAIGGTDRMEANGPAMNTIVPVTR